MKKRLKHMAFMLAGCLIMSFNISNFARVGALIPGGFTGISLLIQRIFETYLHLTVPYTVISLTLNSVPILLSFRFLGKKFTLRTLAVVVLTAVLADIMPNLGITEDPVLCAVFGGVLNGAAIGFELLGNSSSGGTELISVFISKRYGKDAWGYIFAGNCIVLTVFGILFGIQGAMYSIILQFVSTVVIQYLYRRYQKVSLFIVTDEREAVYAKIHEITNHDATLISGIGMYRNQPHDVLYSVVARDEAEHLVEEIHRVDPEAFINSMRSDLLKGEFYYRPFD